MITEDERLATAEEWLLSYPAESQEFDAALDHVRWVHDNYPDLRKRCEAILTNVVKHRHEEMRTMKKLRVIPSSG